AGDMVLPRLKKPAVSQRPALSAPSLPVGDVPAPKIISTGKTPLTASKAGSTNVMLMQGMKNALQQSGQNPDLPKSSATAVDADAAGLQPPILPSPDTRKYEPGQAPNNLVRQLSGGDQTLPQSSPLPLSQSSVPTEVGTSSIFGPPVTEPSSGAESSMCEPKVTPWTKECSESGYPVNFVGKISGETRTECPSGETQDIWLNNTCAAPTEQGTTATSATETASPLAESTEAAPSAAANDRADASCGSANGLAAAAAPVSNLCSFGEPSSVSGEGPWRWSCKGYSGGITVSCAAPYEKVSAQTSKTESNAEKAASSATAIEDGKCGESDSVAAVSAPVQNLCAKGVASQVNGDGPWTWACSGLNGGQAAACNAPIRISGECGLAASMGVEGMPQRDLCAAGYASALTGNGPWNWTCSGLYGGEAATCKATPKVDAVCGAASLVGHREAPKDNLCNAGEASQVEGDGPWNWSCAGSNGGSPVSCKASTLADGACGAAHGSAFETTPSENLCSSGKASRVTGQGPWNWNCMGLEGGDTVSCTASLGAQKAAPIKALSSA
ncbi:MAG: hypothetical protein HGA90_07735, partial [Alphaproteobacteria bacterium]|nr:hypothetical protein [Alphaproteobacteria bacterium]